MSYTDAFLDRDKDIIHVVERKNNKRHFSEHPAIYVFYYPDNRGKYKSIFGENLTKVVCNGKKQFSKEKRIHSNKKLYESDVNPVFRFLEENYPERIAPELNLGFFDLEVAFNKELGFAPPDDPFNPITAVALHLSNLEKTICLVVKPDSFSKEMAENIANSFPDTFLMDSEEQLLLTFLDLVDDVDVLSGWNSTGFDIPYLVNRVARTLGKEYTRQLCLWNQFPKKREYEKYGKINETYDLVGRQHLDYLELYRKYTYHEMHSYSLDAISEYELDEKKIAYEGTLDQLYNRDFHTFIDYNRQDVELLVKLDKKLQFIDLANVIAHDNCVILPTTMGSVAQIDQAIINEAHARGMIVPDRVREKKKIQKVKEVEEEEDSFEYYDDRKYFSEFNEDDETAEDSDTVAGAYVAQPKIGVHKWIGSIDLNSLYPSILRALNMSQETLIGQIRLELTSEMLSKFETVVKAWDGKFATPEYELVMSKDKVTILHLDMENGESYDLTGAEIYDLIYHRGYPWMITSNGTIFTTEIKGIIPGLLERWYKERKELQKKAKSFKGIDDKEFAFWDKRQLVKKILLNSLYGALLNVGSRFFDARLGQSTTLTGRCIDRHMAATVNEIFTGSYDYKGDTIIYCDTDSSYFSAYTVYKDKIDSGEIVWNKDTVIEFYDAVCEEVNKTFPEYMKNYHNSPDSFNYTIAAGREIIGSNGLFIKKKRYAIMVYDTEGYREDENGSGKLKAMGLDLKRSDTPSYMQLFLKEILLDVLMGKTEDEILLKIKDFRKTFRAMNPWDMGTPKRVNKLTYYYSTEYKIAKDGSEEYKGKSRIPGHVRAAINYNRLLKLHNDNFSIKISDGMKTIVCKLKDNPLNITSVGIPTDESRIPEWFKELPFNTVEMENAIVTKKIQNLLGVLKWDLKSSLENTTFNSLFSFE